MDEGCLMTPEGSDTGRLEAASQPRSRLPPQFREAHPSQKAARERGTETAEQKIRHSQPWEMQELRKRRQRRWAD